jgi:hypothetical protein
MTINAATWTKSTLPPVPHSPLLLLSSLKGLSPQTKLALKKVRLERVKIGEETAEGLKYFLLRNLFFIKFKRENGI